MPLQLPAGVVATPINDPHPLRGTRNTSFRFEILEQRRTDNGRPLPEAFVGVLDGVLPSGSVDWTYNASIKGAGKISVVDTGQVVDWLNARIRPVAIIETEDGQVSEFSCGVFVPSTPVEKWTSEGRTWDVELLDKNSILDQDVPADSSGRPRTVSFQPGWNVLAAVKGVIQWAGELSPAIDYLSPSVYTTSPMTWDVGTTYLKIINDLLESGNFFSLWVDNEGQYRTTPYTLPENRPTVYSLMAPFDASGPSIMSPDWQRERDIYSIPNRFVAIGQGDSETPAMTAYAVNTDSASPFSYPARGRWITQVETGVEAVDQAALNAYAARKLKIATSVSSTITVQHPILPDLRVNDAVNFVNPEAHLRTKCTVTKTSIPFDPLGLAETEFLEVGGIEQELDE